MGQSSFGMVKPIPTYGMSGRLAAIWSCQTSLARFPHIGQALDLQVWKTNFSSVAKHILPFPRLLSGNQSSYGNYFERQAEFRDDPSIILPVERNGKLQLETHA